jgi:hypothetical protein
METAMRKTIAADYAQDTADYRDECEIIEFKPEQVDQGRESLSENFNQEIEVWARRALASNGFGDF